MQRLADTVDSREAFLKFLGQVRVDLVTRESDWQSVNLDAFLATMQEWMQDMGDDVPEHPHWQTFARIVAAGRGCC